MCAAGGIALLALPHEKDQGAPASTAYATTDPSPAATVPALRKPTAGTTAWVTPAASSPPAAETAVPAHGEGVAGDPAIQHTLEAAWPADLPGADERKLLTAARALLRADATGIGRGTWPEVFPRTGPAVAPAFATARFRIQAAIARRGSSPDKAVVHLVWAGEDRGGTYTDLRITDWFFTHTIKKGAMTWSPQPRT
jgi:hypothetical protein